MKYVARKLASSLVLLVVGTATIFALIFSNSGGVARQILGQNATEEQVAERTAQLGLDQPVLGQYWEWVTGALTGDLGRSYYTGELVTNVLSTRVPVTLSLVLISVLLMLVCSVAIGVTAAVRGGWLDRVLQSLGVLGTAVPNFVIAIALVFAFAIAVAIFPATGYITPDEDLGGWAASLVLPVLAVLIGSVASAAQQFRGATIDALKQDFVRTLRARGIPEHQVILRHVLRNAAIPGLTTISLQTIGLMGGVVVIERVFALPGIAAQLSTSAVQGDVPIVMGAVLFTIVVVVSINILLDLTSAWLNPKARLT